jgi:hypothetical protein
MTALPEGMNAQKLFKTLLVRFNATLSFEDWLDNKKNAASEELSRMIRSMFLF